VTLSVRIDDVVDRAAGDDEDAIERYIESHAGLVAFEGPALWPNLQRCESDLIPAGIVPANRDLFVTSEICIQPSLQRYHPAADIHAYTYVCSNLDLFDLPGPWPALDDVKIVTSHDRQRWFTLEFGLSLSMNLVWWQGRTVYPMLLPMRFLLPSCGRTL